MSKGPHYKIKINDMFSRIGKATENMHLTLANVKKKEKQMPDTSHDALLKKMTQI